MGFKIQVTRTAEFQHGLWVEYQLKAKSGMQRVLTIPEALQGVVCPTRFLQGKTGFQSGEVCMAA